MGGPSIASLKFGFWLVCLTFLLHCLMIPTAVTAVRPRLYKEKRGVRLIGLMPREAYVPPSIKSKRIRGFCCLKCFGKKWCRAFNADESTGKCELFDAESGGSLINDTNSSYFALISTILCGEMAVEHGHTVASGVKDGEAVNIVCNDGYDANPSQAICNKGIFNNVTCVRATTTPTTTAPNQVGCILLIGGAITNDVAPVEYYHPAVGVECNLDIIGNMSTERIRGDTQRTSGCYLPSTQEIVIREKDTNDKPSMVYGLEDGSATQLPLPYDNKYIPGSTAASVGPLKCISCGGYSGGGIFAEYCYQFDPSLDGSKWMPIAPQPYARRNAASVSLTTNDFFVVGGKNGAGCHNHMFRFNVGAGTWLTDETAMSTQRCEHAAAPLSETEFIVCGGVDRSGSILSTCEIYDTTQKTWRTTGSLNQARRAFAMISFEGDIYALGGSDVAGSLNTVRNMIEQLGNGKWGKRCSIRAHTSLELV